MITIFTDGSSTGKVGDGGWGSIIRIDGQQDIELSGSGTDTTNNRMELMGAIGALQYLKKEYPEMYEKEEILVISDSQYVVNGISKWIYKWIQKGFKVSGGKTRTNRDLWVELFDLATENIRFEWTRGHVGHIENERCDVLAKAAKASLKEIK